MFIKGLVLEMQNAIEGMSPAKPGMPVAIQVKEGWYAYLSLVGEKVMPIGDTTPLPTSQDAFQASVDHVARHFASVLSGWLTPGEMKEVVERNLSEENEGVCHSHDFCDANMAMLEALQKLNVVPAEFSEFSDEVTELFNNAWSTAKANDFYINESNKG